MKYTFNDNYAKLWLVAFIASLTIMSCSKWDDYKKYTKDGEVIYTGKLDPVLVLSGKGRVRMLGLIKADPKIVKCKIYWNNFKDSVVYDVVKGDGLELFDKIFAVDEGVKNFTILTFDDKGNQSVPVQAVGTSYGSAYRRLMSNRPIQSVSFATNPNRTLINWDAIDLSPGPINTEVVYTLNGISNTVETPITQITAIGNKEFVPQTIINGFDYRTTGFKYRTVYRPDANCIDTLCTPYTVR